MDLVSLFLPHSETSDLLTDYLTQEDYNALSFGNRELRVTLVSPAPWSILFPIYVALGYYRPEAVGLGNDEARQL